MSDQEAHERTYTFFHEDGPIELTEHELTNDYMRLRESVALKDRQLAAAAELHIETKEQLEAAQADGAMDRENARAALASAHELRELLADVWGDLAHQLDEPLAAKVSAALNVYRYAASNPATEGEGARREFDPSDSPSVLDSSIDIEGAEAGWTGALDPASEPKP